MPEDMPDLSHLNDGEREVLRLFAQGHTAKSVAALTGKSVGSINERLRDARRKTGVGSSRALSRHLADQENRDMIIGVEHPPAQEPDALEAAGVPGPALFRGAVMIAIIATVLTSATLFMKAATPAAQDVVNPAEDDPVLAGSLWGPTPSERYVLLRKEKRDPIWADATEKALIARYAILLRKYDIRQPVRALCGATQCEIALKVELQSSRIAKLTKELQDRKLGQSLEKLGLRGDTASFSSLDNSYVHSSYWLRASGVSAAPVSAGPAPVSR